MKLTKRVLALCLILAMWLSLTGCGTDNAPAESTDTTASSTAVTTTTTTGGETSATITVDSAPVTVTVTKPAPSIATTAQTTTAAKPTTTTTATTTTTKPTTRPAGDAAIDEDGIYETKEDVALYLHTYGKLPKNFVTKSQYNSLGKPADKCCGGDRFYNKEGLLPNKAGRLYYECDIDTYGITSRGAKRIVYSNDGLIYYTGDHYGSFTLMYGTP